LFASAAAPEAFGQERDGLAVALPRSGPTGHAPIMLPEPLAAGEALKIRRIFALQQAGRIEDARAQTARLADTLLLGHILADRYLGLRYRSSAGELRQWLRRFGDHPDAAPIHALLGRRLPPNTVPPPPPAVAALALEPATDPVPEEEAPGDGFTRNPDLDQDIQDRMRDGDSASALRLLARTKGLGTVYDAELRAEIAEALFALNRDAEALTVARTAFRLSAAAGQSLGAAAYIAGLAAWRLEGAGAAQIHFENAAQAHITSPALRSAAAFWAARAHLVGRDAADYVSWMARAAREPRTFYGLLARRKLGRGFGLSSYPEALGAGDLATVAGSSEGWRAFALLQVGQSARADGELRLLAARFSGDRMKSRAVMLVASKAGLLDLAVQLADTLQVADGRPRDALRFPVPRLRPRNGFVIDPALVYALARIESNFDPAARSPVGARGLMQLMPITASYIADDPSLAARGQRRLHDPGLNLDLGQRYVAYLGRQTPVDGDLIRLLASYNAGPGSLGKWNDTIRDESDPLLFIEAIPNRETRHFVQRALTYLWIYAARLHLPAPSLDELAAGAFPRFQSDEDRERIAEAAPVIH
jgi:soluble lytic murein transglycosylase-like protein